MPTNNLLLWERVQQELLDKLDTQEQSQSQQIKAMHKGLTGAIEHLRTDLLAHIEEEKSLLNQRLDELKPTAVREIGDV